MIKLGIVQTGIYESDEKAITNVSRHILSLARKETEIVCLPEQWLNNNQIKDYNNRFAELRKIAKDYKITIIPGAFYEVSKGKPEINSPIIGPDGEIVGKQEKIHPYDYEKKIIRHGTEAKVFKTACKFGIIICYDMVFPNVARTLVKKGAEVILSPSRIIKEGIGPWHSYVHVRSLENRMPILAANVQNQRFGGNSIIVDLEQNEKIMVPKQVLAKKEGGVALDFDFKKYLKSRKIRFSDEKDVR